MSAASAPHRESTRAAAWLRDRRAPIAVLIVSLAAALVLRGHYVKPHGDFFEFRETGRALLAGRLPETTKRAPLYPIVLAGVGSLLAAIGVEGRPPDQAAGEWIGAALAPASALLVYLIARGWRAAGSLWLALAAGLLPIGLALGAYALVEPALAFWSLLAIRLAQRRSRWAQAAAACAAITRLDALGLVAGVWLAELPRGRRAACLRAAAALAPACAWLALTAVTWEGRSRDHYVAQIAERPGLDVRWPVEATLAALLPAERVALAWADGDVERRAAGALRWCAAALLVVGAIGLLRERDPGAIAAVVAVCGYGAVLSVFPFRAERFGYVPAMLSIALVGVGWRYVGDWLVSRCPAQWPRRMIACIVLAACGAAVWAGVSELASVARVRPAWRWELVMIAGAGAVAAAGVALARDGLRRAPFAGIAAGVALMLVQVRSALPILGSGQEMIGVANAARWATANVPAGERILSGVPGLVRLHERGSQTSRSVGFDEMRADDWSGILRECAERRITHILWYDEFFHEQGEYYVAKWRLTRFAPLDESRPAGVDCVFETPGPPRCRVMRLTESAMTPRPP